MTKKRYENDPLVQAYRMVHQGDHDDSAAAIVRQLVEALEYTEGQVPLGHYHGPFGGCVPCKNDAALTAADAWLEQEGR